MDKTIVYSIAIVLALIVATAAFLRKPKEQAPAALAFPTPSAGSYVVEGFPLSNNITFFGPNNTLKDLGYKANDAGKTEWDVWSAARILTEIERVNPYKVDDTSGASKTTLWSSQQIADSIASLQVGSTIDDSATINNLTWSSEKIDQKFKNIINDSQTSPVQTWSSQQISAALANTPGTSVNVIDDTAVAPITTWSSSKIDTLLQNTSTIDDATTSPSSTWSSQKVNALLSDTLPIISPSNPGDIPIITSTGSLADSGFKIDDTVTSITSLWTSNATSNALFSKMDVVPGTAPDQIAVFDGKGGLMGSSLVVQDSAPPNSSVLWSSDKIFSLTEGKQNLVGGATSGNVSFFDPQGQVVDKGITLNDVQAPSSSVLWSSKQIASEIGKHQMLVEEAIPNHVATFDANGQIVDSGTLVDDGAIASSSVLWSSSKTMGIVGSKQNLVPVSTVDNLASFDNAGQVKDSKFSVKDSSSSSPSVLWSSSAVQEKLDKKQDIVSSAISGNLANFDSFGQVTDSGIIFSDNLPAANNVIWSSQKISSNQSTVIPSSDGNLAGLNSAGKIIDVGKKVDDASGPDQSTVWTSAKIVDVVNSKPSQKLGQPGSGKFLIFDSIGQSIESNTGLDDSVTTSSNIWSAQKTVSTFQARAKPQVIGSFAALDASGQVMESGFTVNDSSSPEPNILWSSAKIQSLAKNKQDFVSNPVSGNFVSTDASGQTTMTPYSVNDNSSGPNVLWTSAKITANTASGNPGNLPVIASAGTGLTDSGLKIDDNSAAGANILWSSQKIQSLAPSVNDSAISPNSTWSSEQTALAIQNMSKTKMNLVPAAPVQSLARFSTGGQVESSGFVIDDTAISGGAIWSSLKTDATYQKLIQGATFGKIPILNSSGQIIQSEYNFDDSVISKNTIQSSKQTFDNFVYRKSKVVQVGEYVVMDGIRFGISNPQGLTLQLESPTLGTPQLGAWTYNTVLFYPSNWYPNTTQFVIPSSSSAPKPCVPGWILNIPSVFHSIVRLDVTPNLYRVTGSLGPNWSNNYLVVEKLM
jgi:hypothetical protein